MNPTRKPNKPADCEGCKHLTIEKQVGGTGHCYMFREFMPGCQLYEAQATIGMGVSMTCPWCGGMMKAEKWHSCFGRS